MEDSSLLERMGRELRCPICLSLLSSAVSLSCNHVFCSLCIQKSMKLILHCPVCKVPYQRREVRPAPHMDNLVNVYKSMEASAGINMFMTQNAPPINSSDAEKRAKDESNPHTDRTGKQCKGKKQTTTKKKKLKKSSELNVKNSGRNSQPSIAANKRVQVPQYPLQETLIEPTRSTVDKTKAVDQIPSTRLAIESDHTSMDEKGEPRLSPFFWLREEEDLEKSSQEADDHISDISPVNAPAFSDIKDSDDDVPSKSTSKDDIQSELNGAKYFDSEMFEWSQRACSPDLLSSPVKMQVEDAKQSDEVFKGISKSPPKDGTTNVEMMKEVPSSVNYSNLTKSTRKRERNSCRRGQTKNPNQISGRTSGFCLNQDSAEKCLQNHCGESKLGGSTSEAEGAPKATSDVTSYASAEAELPNEVNENEYVKRSASCGELANSGKRKLGTDTRNCLISHCTNRYPRRTKKHKHAAENHKMDKEVAPALSKGCKNEMLQRSKSFRRSKSGNQNVAQPREEHVDISMINILLGKTLEDIQEMEVPSVDKTMEKALQKSDARSVDFLTKATDDAQLGEQVLRNCDSTSCKTLCVFCGSTEETKGYGEIVHYLNGMQVSADYAGGSNIIHSHKSCAEWAPNVYFEGDVAVNLEAELARGRRIKCCLCGVKGAALGCFHKSCHRSFHVPCAKMVKECRWDEENFVMLCPLHSSSKLPSEMSGSQAKRRKSDPKRHSHPEQSQDAAKHDMQSDLWDSRNSSAKLILCCSALTKPEKEAVSAFQRMSRSTVLKAWCPSATHVITSTDENGAYRRTLKVLMGILEGKWILTIKWIRACMKEKRLVDEAYYEVHKDIHGIMNGPHLGRLRLLTKQPKLFAGIAFYLSGDFLPSYKGYIQDLIVAAGGTILHRRPVPQVGSVSSVSTNIIVYNLELPADCPTEKHDKILKDRRFEAEALALSTGSKVVTNVWILNCISGYKLQDLRN